MKKHNRIFDIHTYRRRHELFFTVYIIKLHVCKTILAVFVYLSSTDYLRICMYRVQSYQHREEKLASLIEAQYLSNFSSRILTANTDLEGFAALRWSYYFTFSFSAFSLILYILCEDWKKIPKQIDSIPQVWREHRTHMHHLFCVFCIHI